MTGDDVQDKHLVHQLGIEPGGQQWQQLYYDTSNGISNSNINSSDKGSNNIRGL